MRMFVASVVLGACAVAVAQESGTFDGSWQVRWESDKLDEHQPEARLTLQGDTGTWRRHRIGVKDACANRDMPVKVVSRGADQIKLEVLESEAMPGCNDRNLFLKRSDAGTFDGHFGNGKPFTVTRE
jgi:hypothetical protein